MSPVRSPSWIPYFLERKNHQVAVSSDQHQHDQAHYRLCRTNLTQWPAACVLLGRTFHWITFLYTSMPDAATALTPTPTFRSGYDSRVALMKLLRLIPGSLVHASLTSPVVLCLNGSNSFSATLTVSYRAWSQISFPHATLPVLALGYDTPVFGNNTSLCLFSRNSRRMVCSFFLSFFSRLTATSWVSLCQMTTIRRSAIMLRCPTFIGMRPVRCTPTSLGRGP